MGDVRCPSCHNTFDPKKTDAMPFCSVRCKMVDLGRWLKEDYGMPVEPEDRDGQPPMTADKDQHHE